MAPPALAAAGLKEALTALDAAQKSDKAVPEGFSAQKVTGQLLSAAAKGEIDASDPSKILSTGLAVVGGVACGAVSIALAPLCASAGDLVGNLIGGLFTDPPAPPPAPSDLDRVVALRLKDYEWIQSRRAELLASSLVKIGSDPTARKQLEAAINEFLPSFAFDAIENPKQRPKFEDDSWFGGFAMLLWPWGVLFGSQLALLSAGGFDVATTDGAILYVNRIGEIIKAHGLSFAGQEKELIARIQGNPTLFTGTASGSTNWAVQLWLYQTIRPFLYPVLEEALAQRLQAIFAGAAIQAKIQLVAALRRLSAQLVAGGIPAAQADDFAQDAAAMLATSSPEAVYQELTGGLGLSSSTAPPSSEKGRGWGFYLLAGLGVAAAAGGAVVAVRAAQGKPPLPPQVQRGADRVSAAIDRGVARARRLSKAW